MAANYSVFSSPHHPQAPGSLPTLLVTALGRPEHILYTYLHSSDTNYLVTGSDNGEQCVAKLASSVPGRRPGSTMSTGSGHGPNTIKCEASRNLKWTITNTGVVNPTYKCMIPNVDVKGGEEQPLFAISKPSPHAAWWTMFYFTYAGHLIPPKRLEFGKIIKSVEGKGTRICITGMSEDEQAVWQCLGPGNEDLVEYAVLSTALIVLDEEMVRASNGALSAPQQQEIRREIHPTGNPSLDPRGNYQHVPASSKAHQVQMQHVPPQQRGPPPNNPAMQQPPIDRSRPQTAPQHQQPVRNNSLPPPQQRYPHGPPLDRAHSFDNQADPARQRFPGSSPPVSHTQMQGAASRSRLEPGPDRQRTISAPSPDHQHMPSPPAQYHKPTRHPQESDYQHPQGQYHIQPLAPRRQGDQLAQQMNGMQIDPSARLARSPEQMPVPPRDQYRGPSPRELQYRQPSPREAQRPLPQEQYRRGPPPEQYRPPQDTQRPSQESHYRPSEEQYRQRSPHDQRPPMDHRWPSQDSYRQHYQEYSRSQPDLHRPNPEFLQRPSSRGSSRTQYDHPNGHHQPLQRGPPPEAANRPARSPEPPKVEEQAKALSSFKPFSGACYPTANGMKKIAVANHPSEIEPMKPPEEKKKEQPPPPRTASKPAGKEQYRPNGHHLAR